jgi:hypothetical protein
LSELLLLTLYIYLFAIAISFGVALLIRIVSRIFSASEGADQSTDRQPQQHSDDDRAPDEEIPVAAISAALFALIGPHRVIHIEHSPHEPQWSAEGRVSHHLSHELSRRKR